MEEQHRRRRQEIRYASDNRESVLRWRVAITLTVALFLVFPRSSNAQSFGQWWWQGAIGLSRSTHRNLQDESSVQSRRESIDLQGEVNGYLGHPVLGKFKLGLRLSNSKADRQSVEQHQRLSGNLMLNLLPRSAYPSMLFFRRRDFDYELAPGPASLVSAGLPRLSQSWGSRVTAREGPLKGLTLGQTKALIEFPASRDTSDTFSLSYSRQLSNSSHALTMNRHADNRETQSFDGTKLNSTLRTSVDFGSGWSWSSVATGYQSDSQFEGRIRQSISNYQLNGTLEHRLTGADFVRFTSTIANSNFNGSETELYGISASYIRRIGPRWSVRPVVSYSEATSGAGIKEAFSSGLVVRRFLNRGGPWKADLRGESRFRRSAAPSAKSTEVSYGLGAAIHHSTTTGSRQDFSFNLARNELQLREEFLLEEPAQELERTSELGTFTDSENLDLSIERTILGFKTTLFGKWSHSRRDEPLRQGRSEAERWTSNIRVSRGRIGFGASSGGTDTDSLATGGSQSLVYFAGHVSWRPRRFLDLRASYRTDRRNVRLAPDLSGNRVELSAKFKMGLLKIEGKVREIVTEQIDGTTRSSQTAWLSVSRVSAGWLPIISAPKRRGTVR